MDYCTIVIFAHANAGKTTVTENILYETGIISRIGRVDNGTTITDSMETERLRGITIRSSYVTFRLKNRNVQLLDTPGHIDFSAEVVRAMRVLDAAIFVISGVEGIEAQTYYIWNMLKKMNVPIIFFVNKLDRMGADYNRTVNELKAAFSERIVSLQDINLSDDNIFISRKRNVEIVDQITLFDEITLNKIMRGKIIKLYDEDQDLLEDVLIEIHQAIEMCNIYSNILSGTMDAFASVISNNLNIVMKVLTVITIVMAIPNIIFSFYGMNVTGLPIAHWWFPTLVAVIACIIATIIFIKKDMFH